MNKEPRRPRFHLGLILSTPGAQSAIEERGLQPLTFIRRHVVGDWGVVCSEDWQANEQALREGTRLLSAYMLDSQTKLWIITEADRTVTTLLLPEEY